jgi:hypothetical protein
MNQTRRAWFIVGIILIGVLVGITRANLIFARANPGGNDFLTRWVATRAFLFEGLSPYSDEVALRIQMMAYGHPARPQDDQMRMAYPLYAVFVFAPYALIEDYPTARALWMTTLEVSAVLLAILGARLVNWRPSRYNMILWILFSVFGYFSVRSFINGNVVTLLTFFMVAALWALQRRLDILAGGLLALITIKPQIAVLLLACIFIWAVSHRRWGVIGWTVLWLLFLIVAGMFAIPDWLGQNLSDVMRYPSYTPAGTVQAALRQLWPKLGVWPGRVLTLALSIWLLSEWRSTLGKSYERFLAGVCLTLVISQWIGIQTDPGNFIILILPLAFIFARAQSRWGNLTSIGIGIAIVFLLVGLWALFLLTLQKGEQPVQSPIMFFSLPAFVIMGLWFVQHAGRRTEGGLGRDSLVEQD